MIIAYTVYTQCTQARAHIVHMYEVFIILIFLLFSCPFYSMRSIFLYFRNLICIVWQVFRVVFSWKWCCYATDWLRLCVLLCLICYVILSHTPSEFWWTTKFHRTSPNYWRNATNTRCAQIQWHLASSRFCRQWRNEECFALSEAHK